MYSDLSLHSSTDTLIDLIDFVGGFQDVTFN